MSESVKGQFVTNTKWGNTDLPYRLVTIGTLPDEVLLEIFDFYVVEAEWPEAWYTLVHVCRRWRNVVASSLRRLKLQLLCTDRRPVKEMLAVWNLPIIVRGINPMSQVEEGANNIITALKHNDRICEIDLRFFPSSVLERFAAVMQEPFPALKFLQLRSNDQTAAVLPDMFLGGTTPPLRSLILKSILFPTLRKLLLPASHLVLLHLLNIPNSKYTSPEAMIDCLSALTNLETLRLEFDSLPPLLEQESRRSPPLTRTLLPALSSFHFKGVSNYLDDLVAQIEASLLHIFRITFFNQPSFDILQLPQFIGRAEKLKALYRACVVFDTSFV